MANGGIQRNYVTRNFKNVQFSTYSKEIDIIMKKISFLERIITQQIDTLPHFPETSPPNHKIYQNRKNKTKGSWSDQLKNLLGIYSKDEISTLDNLAATLHDQVLKLQAKLFPIAILKQVHLNNDSVENKKILKETTYEYLAKESCQGQNAFGAFITRRVFFGDLSLGVSVLVNRITFERVTSSTVIMRSSFIENDFFYEDYLILGCNVARRKKSKRKILFISATINFNYQTKV
ncbi:YEL057C [Saccharomyces arboricola H-6]|uniref:YEL057C n=1 Tax=Saccharomyces arboricola (strain H-6 / AS 2.3317 / CBS 10644) TaxID=1160507 RepID=J8Q353_SACAR|nr:YEL057C [Saccharomyces arboricola H-6]